MNLDRLRTMEVFATVVESGGFATAARRLGMSPPAVTRAVATLETRLGARLINRTTRSLSLTEAGRGLLESTRRLLAELDEAEQAAAGATIVPSGHLRLTAPLTFGRMHLMPVLAAFLREQPKVTATLITLDRIANLIEEGFDLAVRIAHLPDSTIVARRVGEVRRVLVASPGYLAHHGQPDRPEDLRAHELVAFDGMLPDGEWRFQRVGQAGALAVTPRLTVNDALGAILAAERGDGITGALSYMVAPQLAAGSLVTLLERFAPPPVPVQIVYPQSRLLAAKVRAFVDFAAPRLALALDA
jgi:DNA-binding transcriptional LysR family regulator